MWVDSSCRTLTPLRSSPPLTFWKFGVGLLALTLSNRRTLWVLTCLSCVTRLVTVLVQAPQRPLRPQTHRSIKQPPGRLKEPGRAGGPHKVTPKTPQCEQTQTPQSLKPRPKQANKAPPQQPLPSWGHRKATWQEKLSCWQETVNFPANRSPKQQRRPYRMLPSKAQSLLSAICQKLTVRSMTCSTNLMPNTLFITRGAHRALVPSRRHLPPLLRPRQWGSVPYKNVGSSRGTLKT